MQCGRGGHHGVLRHGAEVLLMDGCHSCPNWTKQEGYAEERDAEFTCITQPLGPVQSHWNLHLFIYSVFLVGGREEGGACHRMEHVDGTELSEIWPLLYHRGSRGPRDPAQILELDYMHLYLFSFLFFHF